MDRKKKAWLHALKILQWVQSSVLKGFVAWAISRRKHKVIGAKIKGVAVEITRLDQNGKEVDSLKIFKEHKRVFA